MKLGICFVYIVVLEARNIGSTVAGIVLIYSLSFCEALTFLARAHADVSAPSSLKSCSQPYFSPLKVVHSCDFASLLSQCQMDLNSIERIQEYSGLTPEKGLSVDHSSSDSCGDSDTKEEDEEKCIEMPVLGSSRARMVGAGSGAINSVGREESLEGDCMDASSHPLILSGTSTSTRTISTVHALQPPGAAWPSLGRVEFRNISLKYNSCATPVLR